ncbi:tRNA ligase 1 [Venturia nashicola]|uniref:tRNA ligase 1 n=1 Tax=Venturia nashicola TaxID=86259 RepID=A0A4Z1NZ66_9PEZI|nr:tRNA ligase 1 [Venturia nashicola]
MTSTNPKTVVAPPTGVFVPVPTFFHPPSGVDSLQAKLDTVTQVKHSIHLARNGVRGLVLLGSTGEAIHLSRSERLQLISDVRKGLDDAGFLAYPIMTGVLTNSVEEALEWLEDAARAGSDWGLVLVPGYFGTAATQNNIKAWYKVVADHSPLPILVYNYPGVTNQILVEPQTYTHLAQHPNIVGCKMSHGNVSHHIQVSLDPEIDHSKFRVYSGFGQQLGPIVFFGAAGVIDGLAAIYPRTVSYLMDLTAERPIDSKSLAEIQSMQFAVSCAEEYIGAWGIVGIKEGIYRVLGMGNQEGGRLPLKGKLSDEQWNVWDTAMSRMEALERSIPGAVLLDWEIRT